MKGTQSQRQQEAGHHQLKAEHRLIQARSEIPRFIDACSWKSLQWLEWVSPISNFEIKTTFIFWGFFLKHLLQFKQELPQRRQQDFVIWRGYPNKHKQNCISPLSKTLWICPLASKEPTTLLPSSLFTSTLPQRHHTPCHMNQQLSTITTGCGH